MTDRRFYSHKARAEYLASLGRKDARGLYELEIAELHARFYPGVLTYASSTARTPDGGPLVGDRDEYTKEWGVITARYEERLKKERA